MKRALVALAALLACGPAFADPVTIISLITYALVAAEVITVTTAAWIAVGVAIYGTVDARRKARKAQRAATAAYNASLQDRSVTVLSTEAPWLVCYGRAIYGGAIAAILTSDKQATRTSGITYTVADGYKHLVIVLASHQVQAINEVFIDGSACGPVDGSGWVTSGEFWSAQTENHEVTIAPGGNSVQAFPVTVLAAVDTVLSQQQGDSGMVIVPGSYTVTGGGLQINNTGSNPVSVNFTMSVPIPSVRIQKHLGTTSQTVDSVLNGLLPAEWLTTDRLQGLAYVVVSLDLTNQRFQGGPPQIQFDVSGRLVYDPRTTTTAWSANPALCARDYLINEWGLNCLAADVDDSYTNAAANACDAAVQLVDFNLAALASHFATAGNLEGWAATGATASVAAGVLTLASSTTDPQLAKSGLAMSGTLYRAVRVRFKRNAGSGWDGIVYYSVNAGHGFSGSFQKTIAQPTYGPDGYAEATWDMSALTIGGADWTSSTITGVRVDLGTTAADSFDIDWIVVGPLTAPAYTCNGVISTDQAKEAVLQDLAECMGGYIAYGAKWAIQAGAWTASVMDLGDDDLQGQIEVLQGGAGMDEVFNTVRGTFIPAGGWAAAELDTYSKAAYVTADGATLSTDVALPFTDSKARGKNLASLFVERNRLGQVLRYPAKLRAWPLQVGDRVRVTSAEYGLSLAYYRVTDWQFSLAGAVDLTLQQDAAAVYDLPTAATAATAAVSGLPNPWVVAAPAGLTAASSGVTGIADGTFSSRVRVTWTATTEPYLADRSGFVLVRWRRVYFDPVDTWTVLAPVPAGEVFAVIEGVRVGDLLVIEARFQNGVGALSPASVLVHTVVDNSTGRPSQGATADLSLVNHNANTTIAGNTITKVAGGSGWNASAYSKESYVGGAFVAWTIPLFTVNGVMVGLNTDPTTDASYTSLDYAIQGAAGGWAVYEGGSGIGFAGTPVAGDQLSIVYDGSSVRYYVNGALQRTVAAPPNLRLYLDSSLCDVGGFVGNVRFGPLTASTPGATLVNHANMTLAANAATKTSGTHGAWDAAFYSKDGYTSGAFVSWQIPAGGLGGSTSAHMVGLNTDPTTDANYTSLDYAWYPNSSALQIYESGASQSFSGSATYAVGDVLAVAYDGLSVRYLHNGVVKRTVPALPGLTFFADSSFAHVGASVSNIQFGPLSNLHRARGANLIDCSWWKVGKNPLTGAPAWGTNQSGAGAADAFVSAAGPDGAIQPLWQATQGAGGVDGGGWNGNSDPTILFPVDTAKTYLFACYFKQVSVAGGAPQIFFGPLGSTVDNLNTTTAQSNPYFANANLTVGKWYLALGWVYPQGSTGNTNANAGVWDCTTGQLVVSGLNFCWETGITACSCRAYQFYGSTAGSLMQFAAPQVYLCDGSEPWLQDLLSMITPTAWIGIDAATSALTATATALTATGLSQTTSGPTLSYTNDTGAAIAVQVEPSFYDGFCSALALSTVQQFFMDQTGAVGGSTTEILFDFKNAPAPAAGNYQGFGRAFQYSLAAAATLTCTLKTRITSSAGGASVTVDAPVLRMTAIKR